MTLRQTFTALGTLLAVGALQSCGSDSAVSEEKAHQERDAELAQRLANTTDATSNPFAEAQTLAEDSIGAAIGSDLDQTWVRKMIEHQEGAARMAQLLLKLKARPEVVRVAERVSLDAHARVEALKQLRSRSVTSDSQSAQPFDNKTSDLFAKMTQADDSSVDTLWARKMVEYNRGGIAFAGVETSHGKDPRIRDYAREVASALMHEADALERLTRELQ